MFKVSKNHKYYLTPTFSTPHTDYSYDPTIEPPPFPTNNNNNKMSDIEEITDMFREITGT